MTNDEQRRKAEEFRALHTSRSILILPNAWDVVSARIFELEGFKAIGTTSAGIAATLGYPDGERMSLDETIEVVGRIARCVRLPVSADLEAGYAATPEGVAVSAQAALRAGAVGINLEDSTGDPSAPLYERSRQCDRIRAVREMATAEGVDLVINARTDVYLSAEYEDSSRLPDTVERADAYRAAGADCIFVPDMGTLDKETIARLVNEIESPLNVIAGHHTPPLAELEEMGVARLSFGPRPMRAALALIRKIAREWRDVGTYTAMLADALSYSEVNELLTPRARGTGGSPRNVPGQE